MATPQVNEILGYYRALAERWLDRWGTFMSKGKAGTYTMDAWVGDTARTVTDMMLSVQFAAKYLDPPGFTVEVPMSISPGDPEVVQAVMIRPPGFPLAIGPLRATDDPTVVVPVVKVQFWLAMDDTVLIVRLSGMDVHPPRNDLTPGRRFSANIYRQGDPLTIRAQVVLEVT